MELTSKHIRWCWKKEIYFSPLAIGSYGHIVKIVMTKNGKSKVGKEKYPQKTKEEKTDLYKIINELYSKVYEKNHSNQLVNIYETTTQHESR
ncbi:conserved hypothetical protein [Tenacibaculum maritimum]|nr:conserved hypothetical protein [Tenacibaculum maritimum]